MPFKAINTYISLVLNIEKCEPVRSKLTFVTNPIFMSRKGSIRRINFSNSSVNVLAAFTSPLCKVYCSSQDRLTGLLPRHVDLRGCHVYVRVIYMNRGSPAGDAKPAQCSPTAAPPLIKIYNAATLSIVRFSERAQMSLEARIRARSPAGKKCFISKLN